MDSATLLARPSTVWKDVDVHALKRVSALALCFVRPGVPSLLHLVRGVILVRPQKQVRGIYATAIVARMTNEQPRGYGADVQFVGETVCLLNPTIEADVGVSRGVGCRRPRPACRTVRGLLDLLVETFRWRSVVASQF